MKDLCQWASFQKDLEEVNNLKCMIEEPTRITTDSEVLLVVILTNAPKMFKNCGTYEPEISNHRMIYGELTDKVRRHKTKTISFRTAMRSMTTGRRSLSQWWINMHT